MRDIAAAVPIAVTGMGLVTAQGTTLKKSWLGISSGVDVLRRWDRADEFNAPALANIQVAQCGELPQPDDLPSRLWRTLARIQQLAAVAVDEAMSMAALPKRIDEDLRPVGLYLATTVCGMDINEQFYKQLREKQESANVQLMRRVQPYELLAFIARRHRLTGPRMLSLSTCVGSAMAIEAACDAIRLGRVEMAIAGGSEALCHLLISGFNSLRLVAVQGCRPFDQQRPGITVGEGAGMMVLESVEHAHRRGVQPLGYIRGFSATCDAYHITSPEPTGHFARVAIQRAIASSGLAATEIGYINAHGTGTRDNDAMEASAITDAFRDEGSAIPPVSSTKRLTGHTFAAAGAIEAVICLQAISQGILPPNTGCKQVDSGISLPLVLQPRQEKIMAALSCNFAFGGNNTALIFSHGPVSTVARNGGCT